MKISILASGAGEKAKYLHDFFKEGNRVKVESLLTDFPDSPLAHHFREEGIEVVDINLYNNLDSIARSLKENDVKLLVVDDYVGPLPQEFTDIFGEAVVYPSAVNQAPLEVIEVAERLFYKPKPKTPELKKPSDQPPTLEEEWAEVLNIDYDPAEEQPAEPIESATSPTPPENPETEEERSEPQILTPPPYVEEPQPIVPPQLQSEPPAIKEQGSEPMPDTYLLWSVIITILCCFIPGVIAIINSARVSSKYYTGDIEGAKRASRNAQIWCIVSIVAGVIWSTLYLPLSLLGSIQ